MRKAFVFVFLYFFVIGYNDVLIAQQGRILPPTNLTAKFVVSVPGTSGEGKVVLKWNWTAMNPAQRYTPFMIHRALDGTPPFPIIGTTLNTEYVDTSLSVSDTTYYYYVTKLDVDSSVSVPSAVVAVEVPAFQRVIITSQPPVAGMVGKFYEYKVRAISTIPDDIITFKLVQNNVSVIPPGMVIDGTTGHIRWTPSADGLFNITVEAECKKGFKAQQRFTICIAPIATFSSLSGRVTDLSGKSLAGVTVLAYFVSIDPVQISDCFGNRSPIPSGITNAEGNYFLDSLRTGDYYLIAVPKSSDYLSKWYKDAKDLHEADKFPVVKDLKNIVNFVLESVVLEKIIQITGVVRDENNRPIEHAFVRPYFIHPSTNMTHHVPGDVNLISVTDREGNYLVRVPAKTSFILYATADDYYSEFYDNKLTPFDAERLLFTSDQQNLDFVLRKRISTKRKLSGGVSNRRDGVESWIVVYAQHATGIASVESIPTGSDGFFSTPYLPEQKLMLQAVPFDLKKMTPSYYTGSPLVGLSWRDAIMITESGFINNSNMYVDDVEANGIGSVEGQIFDQMNKPVGGAIVKALDEKANVVGIAVTTRTGYFNIDALTEGPLTMVTDKISYEQKSSNAVLINYGTMREAKGIFIRLASVPGVTTGVEELFPVQIILNQNYPNPVSASGVSGMTTISFSLPSPQHVRLVVTDVLGRDVTQLVDGFYEGSKYSVAFDVRNIPAGVYFYSLVTNNKILTKKLLVTK